MAAATSPTVAGSGGWPSVSTGSSTVASDSATTRGQRREEGAITQVETKEVGGAIVEDFVDVL